MRSVIGWETFGGFFGAITVESVLSKTGVAGANAPVFYLLKKCIENIIIHIGNVIEVF